MATISIARKHTLSHKKARDVAEKIAKDLNKRFDLEYAWDGEHIDFERPGVERPNPIGTSAVPFPVASAPRHSISLAGRALGWQRAQTHGQPSCNRQKREPPQQS